MAAFSDEEDRQLVQLAATYVKARRRVNWSLVAEKMRPQKWSPEKLQQRIKTLMRRLGTDVLQFPPRFFRKSLQQKSRSQRVQPAGSTPGITEQLLVPLSPEDTYNATARLFRVLTRRDVRANKRQLNAGRIWCECRPKLAIKIAVLQTVLASRAYGMVAVSSFITETAFQEGDVFLDVGSGIGNVLVQIALQTRASCVVGIEIQDNLVAKGMKLMPSAVLDLPHLQKICVVAGDIRGFQESNNAVVCAGKKLSSSRPGSLINSATVLYCHDTVFEEDAVLAVINMYVVLPHLRLVGLTTLASDTSRSQRNLIIGSLHPLDLHSRTMSIPGTGDDVFSLTSARDMAKAIAELLNSPNKWCPYTYVQGSQVTWKEIADADSHKDYVTIEVEA